MCSRTVSTAVPGRQVPPHKLTSNILHLKYMNTRAVDNNCPNMHSSHTTLYSIMLYQKESLAKACFMAFIFSYNTFIIIVYKAMRL